MTGSIQIKKGRANYFAVLNAYDSNGKRKPKWIDTGVPVRGNNKRKADAKLNELLVKFQDNCIDICKDTGFLDFMVQWLETQKFSLSPTTYDAYKITMQLHIVPYFEKKKYRVTDITPIIVQNYTNDKLKTLSPNTVRKHLANISKCLDSAVKQSIIAFNPVKRDRPA